MTAPPICRLFQLPGINGDLQKACTQLHVYRPHATPWTDVPTQLINQEIRVSVHICLHHALAEISHSFDGQVITPSIKSCEKQLECRCETCFAGYFGRRIPWKHHFLRLTEIEVKVRLRLGQTWLDIQTQCFIPKTVNLVQFSSGFQKCHLLGRATT